MSKRPDKHSRTTLSAQVRSAILGSMETHLPLGIQGRELDDEKVWDILMYASVNGTTIETACHELADTPSGNTVREHLREALEPTREAVVGLDEKLTQALQSQLPKGLFRRLDHKAYEVGIDLVEIPYHGQPATDEDRTDNLITLPTKTLEQILDQINAPDVIDYLSIDVEGAEERILGRFPFDRYTFTTITIERPSASL